MEYLLFTVGLLGIALCLAALCRLTFGTRADGKLEITTTEIKPDQINASDYKEPGSFWSGAKPVAPMRDIPFTREEREQARAKANAEANESQNVPNPETVNLEKPKPKFDYPNFEGFPFDGDTYDEFNLSMMTHGFVIRFIMASHEVQVIYTPPKSRNPMEALRRFYSPPKAIFPQNLLHDEGRMRTALWAMRKLKSDERPPELDAFAYL